MKLSKPSDIDEEPSEQMSGEQIDVTEPDDVDIETVAGKQSLPEAVELHAAMFEEPENYGIAQSETVKQLRETVAEQQKMIGELVETLEILTMAVENGHSIEHAHDVWADRGNETALEWEEDAYEFKSSRYE